MCAMHWRYEKHKFLLGKLEGNRLLGKHGRVWEDNRPLRINRVSEWDVDLSGLRYGPVLLNALNNRWVS